MDTASSLNTRTGSCVTLYSSDLSQPTVGITIEGAQVQVRLLQCAYYHVAVPLIISRADTRYSEAVSKDRSSTYERKQEIIACTQSEKKKKSHLQKVQCEAESSMLKIVYLTRQWMK